MEETERSGYLELQGQCCRRTEHTSWSLEGSGGLFICVLRDYDPYDALVRLKEGTVRVSVPVSGKRLSVVAPKGDPQSLVFTHPCSLNDM